ncbi:MAG: TonB-dependent siderophore receptor [Achromobacter mucicolens]|jgi:iron complex outermembrane receptor protein|uniref:TonB-dependent siderophore receptor n=1 Tax=Achromobacter mucicolens TaxID=1389922 RepID=UPI00243240F0|nr:TonB-dependent siderophore receptor [Achromobacter mucicolens]MDF2863059.1 TonB-dependent siderophore receptor [Achromobacter mucicolens]
MSLNSYSALAAAIVLAAPFAAVAQTDDSPVQLPAVRVTGDDDAGQDGLFNPVAPPAVNKSSVPLSKTPQSITVVPRAVLDAQQAQTLADALHNVPGVVANQFGRRGWDDLIIRGQVASDSLFLDGLRTAASNRVAEQLFGVEQVEVLKGPASLLYGQVLPGGLVNMVSKRPRAETFAEAATTQGSHEFRQATLDMGTPLSDNGKAAFRVNALAMNSNDETDHVWFKNRFIAPSLSLDLGPRTDFTILTSYQERQYIRQQGLPIIGTVQSNPNGAIPRDRFTGEPGQDPYRGYQSRVGYALTHRFDNGWTVNQNARWQSFTLNGQLVANGLLRADNRTLRRTATDQHWDGDTITLDTNAQRRFDTGFGAHDITVGVDYLRTRENSLSYNCSVRDLDVYQPVYGSPINCPANPRTDSSTTVRAIGVYARDQIALGERWNAVFGLRHDTASTYSTDHLTQAREDSSDNAITGSGALMYEIAPGVRPYISYATSFYPNSGTNVDGNTFKPESGRQWEAGVKIDLDDGATSITVAAFDLERRNVLQADPVNDGYSIAVGKQRTRGAELGWASDLGNGLSLMGGYAYLSAVVVDDGGQVPSTNNTRLNSVPRHSFNVTARYRMQGSLAGWELTGGLRAEGSRYTYGYDIPGYLVADAGVAYDAGRWRAALTMNNLFDKQYYAGGVRNAVALGDGRTTLVSLALRY